MERPRRKARKGVRNPHGRNHSCMGWYEHAPVQKLKGMKKENMRDNMTMTELVLNMLAETSTTDISKEEKPETLSRISMKGKHYNLAGQCPPDSTTVFHLCACPVSRRL